MNIPLEIHGQRDDGLFTYHLAHLTTVHLGDTILPAVVLTGQSARTDDARRPAGTILLPWEVGPVTLVRPCTDDERDLVRAAGIQGYQFDAYGA